MATATLPEIHPTRVAPVRLAERSPQAFWRFRHGKQMNVIGQQTVAPNLNPAVGAPLCHQVQIGLVVRIGEKSLLPAMAALTDVVRQARDNDACQSGHGLTLPRSDPLVNN